VSTSAERESNRIESGPREVRCFEGCWAEQATHPIRRYGSPRLTGMLLSRSTLCSKKALLAASFLAFSSTQLVSVVVVSALAGGIMSPKNIVVVGAGIQGASVAFHLARQTDGDAAATSITILEAKGPASAASGKGGGFMARGWGDGTPTQRLHELAFDMYESLAAELNCESYRKLPVLSVTPGYDGIKLAKRDRNLAPIVPDWLDGSVGRISAMGMGDDTAQITPSEFVEKMLDKQKDRIKVVYGTCVGVDTDQGSERGSRKVTAVRYVETGSGDHQQQEEKLIPADAVVVSAGPWSCAAEDWFEGAVQLPMEGIKSTSIVWHKPQETESVDATALFCGEDNRFGTHRKLEPPLFRPIFAR